MNAPSARVLVTLTLFALLASTGCGSSATQSPAAASRKLAEPRVVTILAAASTVDAVRAIAEAFEKEHATIKVRPSFGASSALAQQIANGAPAELFLSASDEWADFLAKDGLVAERVDRLGNKLVVVVPADSQLEFKSLADLDSDQIKHLAMADPAAVPAGKYGRAALEKVGIWERVQSRVVSGVDVRQTMTFVERGAAEAGIVYATDAATSKAVRVALTIPADATGPIRYPLVLLKAGADLPEAHELYEFLQGTAAASVFESFGFAILADEPARPMP